MGWPLAVAGRNAGADMERLPAVGVHHPVAAVTRGVIQVLGQAGYRVVPLPTVVSAPALGLAPSDVVVTNVSALDDRTIADGLIDTGFRIVALVEEETARSFAQAFCRGADAVLSLTTGPEALVTAIRESQQDLVSVPRFIVRRLSTAAESRLDAKIALAGDDVMLLRALSERPQALVAVALGISPRTLRRRIRTLCDRLQVVRTREAIAVAARHGLLDDDDAAGLRE